MSYDYDEVFIILWTDGTGTQIVDQHFPNLKNGYEICSHKDAEAAYNLSVEIIEGMNEAGLLTCDKFEVTWQKRYDDESKDIHIEAEHIIDRKEAKP